MNNTLQRLNFLRFMKPDKQRQANIIEIIYKLLLSVLVILICFPPVELTYGIGIDPPLAWVFNNLFKTGLENGRNIIFPQGPLFFFMYPLQENFIIVLIFTIIFQFGIIYNLFTLTSFNDEKNWIIPLLFSIILIKLSNFASLILINISLFYLLHYHNNNAFYKYGGLVLTAFAFYIRIQVAVISVIITASFLIINLIRNKKYIVFLGDMTIQFLLIILIWFLMYKSLRGFFPYLYGMLNLAVENSAAVSLYPKNNWLYLIIFILTTVSIPFLQRNRMADYFGFLFVLSLFAAWKHGMAREDISHARSLFIYVFMVMSLFILFYKKNRPVNIIIISIGLLAFYLNLKNLPTYNSMRIEFLGINNFSDFVNGYSSIKENANKKIKNDLATNKLPQVILSEISESKVDIYPWDYSIIPANNLTWQPRPVLQSFISHTSWLDMRNAEHFDSDLKPEFIIWDLDKVTSDLNGGSNESIDNRFLLNDEPATILQIIRNYEYHFKNKSFLILKKREAPLVYEEHISSPLNRQWDEWISLPDKKGDLIRAKIVIKKNLAGMIKSFLYKDEGSCVYYKLSSGEIFKYKIVPENAKDGLWINPFIFKPDSDIYYPDVESILLKNSNKKLMSKRIQLRWEIIDFLNDQDSVIHSFFRQSVPLNRVHLLGEINTFEGINSSWTNQNKDNNASDCYQGNTSYSVKSNAFSPTFSLNPDTITQAPLYIQGSCWIKGPGTGIKFVISVETEGSFRVYHGVDLGKQAIDKTGWNNVYIYYQYDHMAGLKNPIMKIYLWNKSENDILIDDFIINISENSNANNRGKFIN